MSSLCLYFKVHQPYRLKKYLKQDVQVCSCYEDAATDEANINKVANECYLPANEIMFKAIEATKGIFKVAFSISGVTLALLEKYRPDVIESFQFLVNTGCVEMLGETYYHSLSSLHSKKEFQRQVKMHATLIHDLFGQSPNVFRNTELIYNNSLAGLVTALGFKGILCEGIERLLNGKTVNKICTTPAANIHLLLRNVTLSDDIAFRFGEEQWDKHPLTAEKFAEWIHLHESDTQVINLFMDYETFGIYKKKETGIFDFLKALPQAVLSNADWKFSLPSKAIKEYGASDVYDVPKTISWEDKSKECCVWCENMMQNNTLKKIYSIEKMVLHHNDEALLETWGRLQCADYFYYMADSNCAHAKGRYSNPHETPQNVFEYYNNIITDFEISLIKKMMEPSQRFYYSSIGNLY